jgi:hypothetical protein
VWSEWKFHFFLEWRFSIYYRGWQNAVHRLVYVSCFAVDTTDKNSEKPDQGHTDACDDSDHSDANVLMAPSMTADFIRTIPS